MGTNYYHRTNICECCGRFDQQHICKSMVSFEAPVVWPDESPFAPVVAASSWQEWKARLVADGEVWDEYGKQWDVLEFIDGVEATDPDARRRQFDWMSKHQPARTTTEPAYGMDWLDPDGFSFYGGAFS